MFDPVSYAMGKAASGGGGDITVEPLSVTENGTTTAPSGKAYSPVTVNVPNSYAAGDEGKVVSNGELVAQTAHAEVTENGTIDTTLNNSVVVHVSGGGADEPILDPIKDVVFVDYDGEIVEQYTATEFAALSALPANPTHSGLTAQGWNWTLADAQEYVASYGALVIGQNYTTSDGKTRIYTTKTALTVGAALCIGITTSVKNGVTIDWGDGTTKVTDANASTQKFYSHTYSAPGDHVVTLTATSGTYALGYNGVNSGIFYDNNNSMTSTVSANTVTAVEIGDNVTAIYRQGFVNAPNLMTISIPTSLTDIGQTTGNVFSGTRIKCVVFPNGTTQTYGSGAGSWKFVSFPKTMTYVGNLNSSGNLRAVTLPYGAVRAAQNIGGRSIEKVTVPGDYTVIGSSTTTYFVGATTLLKKLTISASVTSVKEYALYNNKGLKELHMLPTTPPTLSATYPFSGTPATIYVPYSEDHSILNAYKTATNWSTYSSRIQEEAQ